MSDFNIAFEALSKIANAPDDVTGGPRFVGIARDALLHIQKNWVDRYKDVQAKTASPPVRNTVLPGQNPTSEA